MTVTIIFIIAISVAAAIGAVIGIFKKATRLSFWGVTVLLGTLVAYLLATLIKGDGMLYSLLVLCVTTGVVILLILLFNLFKAFLSKRIKNAREYSHYKNMDDIEENEAYKMNAVDKDDKHEYRKYRKKGKKIKDSAGGWGVTNRIIGCIVGGIDWLVATGAIICSLLLFTEFCGISALRDNEVVNELLTSPGWVNIGAKVALDILVIGTIVITVKAGFKKGVFHLITPVVVIAMLAGFGYTSWVIASSEACSGMVTGMQTGMLSAINDINEYAAIIVAEVIITLVLFLLSLIIVIITGKLLPRLLDKFRDNDAFYVIDGVFGVVISLGLLIAALLVIGGIAYTLNDLAFMEKFNEYEAQSSLANAFYKFNPMGELFKNLPLRSWFEPKA